MVTRTKVTERRRAINSSKAGRDAKKARVKAGTPKFPIHVEAAAAPEAAAKK